MAKNMIWHAVQQEKTGKTIEGFVPRQKLAPNAPATERQKNRLTQLINDGFVPRITPQLWAKMTHEQATEQITRGKLAELWPGISCGHFFAMPSTMISFRS